MAESVPLTTPEAPEAPSTVPTPSSRVASSILDPGAVPAWARHLARPARVLVVDDTITNRRLLKAILRRSEFDIHEATNGIEALDVARRIDPDLILLDVMMPEKDGYEVCRELKADTATADIPVIFLTAMTQAADKIKGLELGAVDYITKPFSKGEILARVNTHLEIRMLSESLRAMNRELLAKQRRIEADLKAASAIQGSLIPSSQRKREIASLALDWVFLPCNRIGGDVFNVFRLDEDHVGAYVLDVSGHGVPSAMVTVSVSQSLEPHSGKVLKVKTDEPPFYRLPGPSEVCGILDHEFPFERFQKFSTLVYLLINIRTGVVRYARAAHPRPILVRRSGATEILDEGGTIIGLDTGGTYEEGETRLEPGDRIYLCTDGILEYADGGGDRFGEERLLDVLSSRELPLGETCESVIEAVTSFAGGLPADDDITFVGLEYLGPDDRSAPASETA